MTRNALCTKVNKNIYYLLLICYTIYESKKVVFMKSFKRVIIVVCCLLFISFLLTSYALYYKKKLILNISSINITKISTDKKSFEISIMGDTNNEFKCVAFNDLYKSESMSKGGVCLLTLNINKDYKIYLESKYKKTKEKMLTDYVDNIISFNFSNDVIYMVKGATKDIKYDEIVIDKNKKISEIISTNDDIISVNDGIITAKNIGECEIKSGKKSIKVVVTDIIDKPTLSEVKKEIIPCNKYSKSEAELLDKLLESEINEVGYKTRAGAVQAARFLTLEFKYRIPYFYENGRVHSSGVHFVDGEGRYYKTGLYLDDSKKDEIISKYKGPALWGCPLTNLEPAQKYGYIPGAKMPNGLDCSGFIAWVLKNAGFDPGDIGAGDTEYPYQMTKLGDFVSLNQDLIKSGKIKTGDLINYWGHIGIIIGIDENNIYVAESLPTLGGVVAKKYSKSNITKTFSYVVLMDDYYKKNGNLTDMWN